MQESSRTSHTSSQRHSETVGNLSSKAERRVAFNRAREAGHSVAASARAAGVYKGTGYAWEKLRRKGALHAQALVEATLSRGASLQILDKVAQEGVDRDKIAALQLKARMEGWEAPTQTVNIHIAAGTREWLAMRAAELSEARAHQGVAASAPTPPLAPARARKRIEAAGEPPMSKSGDAQSPPPNFSTPSNDADEA